MRRGPRGETELFDRAVADGGRKRYLLNLYVAGTSAKSAHAITSIKRVCEEHLKGSYDLEVIDIYQQPGLAMTDQIIAAPTLVRKLPLPLRRLIGTMSDTEAILEGLELKARKRAI